MNFGQAVSTVLSKYAVFSGRARRSEYWWFFLFNLIIGIVASIIDAAAGTAPLIGWLVTLALLLPGIAVGVRRLHDTGRAGWWLFIALIPLVGAIVLLVFFCQDSDFDNKYGPSPKALPTHSW